MHSMKADDKDGRRYSINFNGDFSGDILFIIDPGYGVDTTDLEPITIPFEVCKAIVAEYVRSEKITKLEDAEDDEILLRN